MQTRMHTSQQNKIKSWNHDDWCKQKLQIGILSIEICLLTYPPYCEVGAPFPCKLPIEWCPLISPFFFPTLITELGWQAILNRNFFRINDGSPIMANKHSAIVEMFKQLIFGVLQFPWYAKLHAHLQLLSYFPVSLSSWRLPQAAQLSHDFLQAACSTSRRTTLHSKASSRRLSLHILGWQRHTLPV
jgi:hypothetical protein